MKNLLISFSFLFLSNSLMAQTDVAMQVILGSLKHGRTYSRHEVLLQNELTVSSVDDHPYQITKFTLIVDRKNGVPILMKSTNNLISPQMKSELNLLTEGDLLKIVDIYAINGTNQDVISLAPIALQIGPSTYYEDLNRQGAMDTSRAESILNFGNLSYQDYTLEQIQAQRELTFMPKDSFAEHKVTSFKMIITSKDNTPIMASSTSHEFTETMILMLSHIKSGDQIIIEEVEAQLDIDQFKNNTFYLSPMIITVP